MSKIAFEFTLFGKVFTVAWYAIFVTGGMIGALILLAYLMNRRKDEYTMDDALEVFLFAIPFAVVFARLGYSLPRLNLPITSWAEFIDIFDITHGGLTIVAGIPGGALGILIYCAIRKKSPFRVFDTIIPCLLLGQIVGRWGNFVNQELYGLEITNPAFQFFPFGVFIEETGKWHCANFFYEGTFNAIALAVVLFIMIKYGDKLKVGTISIGYIIWYGVLRGTLEFVKINQMMVGNVRLIQLICYIVAIVGVVVLVLLQKGKIKFETEKMRKAHFITTSVDDEIMSNNYNYDVATSFEITDEGVNGTLDGVESKEVNSNE